MVHGEQQAGLKGGGGIDVIGEALPTEAIPQLLGPGKEQQAALAALVEAEKATLAALVRLSEILLLKCMCTLASYAAEPCSSARARPSSSPLGASEPFPLTCVVCRR